MAISVDQALKKTVVYLETGQSGHNSVPQDDVSQQTRFRQLFKGKTH